MANAPLTDAEIQEIKQRLGYGSMTVGAFPYIATAPVFETVIKQNVNDYGIGYVRGTVLPNLRQIDTDIQDARARYKASRLEGEVTLNPREHADLVGLRRFWVQELSSTVRVPVYEAAAAGGSPVVLL